MPRDGSGLYLWQPELPGVLFSLCFNITGNCLTPIMYEAPVFGLVPPSWAETPMLEHEDSHSCSKMNNPGVDTQHRDG